RGNRVRWITSVNARTAIAPPKTTDAGLEMRTPVDAPSERDDTAGAAPPRALHRQDTAGPTAGSDGTSFIPRPLIVQVVGVDEQRCVRHFEGLPWLLQQPRRLGQPQRPAPTRDGMTAAGAGSAGASRLVSRSASVRPITVGIMAARTPTEATASCAAAG